MVKKYLNGLRPRCWRLLKEQGNLPSARVWALAVAVAMVVAMVAVDILLK